MAYNISKAESELDGIVPWLMNIEARAPGSPVIVVGTHRDMIAEGKGEGGEGGGFIFLFSRSLQ